MSTDEAELLTTAVEIKTTAFSRHESRYTSFLIEAISGGDDDAVRRLLAAGQDPDMKADWYRYACIPPLALAMQQREFGIARMLIEHGADVRFNFDENDGWQCSTAMTSAILFGGEVGIQMLLDAGHPVTRGMLMLAIKGRSHRSI